MRFTKTIRRMIYPMLLAGLVLAWLCVVQGLMASEIDGTNKFTWAGKVSAINLKNEAAYNVVTDRRADRSAGVWLSSTSLNATEGGNSASYTIVLTSEPSDSVTISVTAGSQISVSLATLTFTADDWNTPQGVMVTATDDNLAEGHHDSTITHAATSHDSDYNEITINAVTVNITDNDTDGVSISSTSLSATEGGTSASYTMALTSVPSETVSISLDSDSQISVSPATLTFTPDDWNSVQTVTVTAVDDDLVEGHHHGTITHNATSHDSDYNDIGISVITVNITDNDTAGVWLSSGSLHATEGGSSASYTIALTTEPTDAVTISLTSDTQTSVAPLSLTFTTADWDTPQTVTVSAVDDNLVEGNHNGTVTHAATSNDTDYNTITINPVTVNITDNDTAGVSISSTSLSATEGGANDSYTVVLTSQPTDTVTVSLTSDSQTSVTPAELTFTTANWNIAQTVTVDAVDDDLVESNHNGTITHAATSSDTDYNGIGINSVTVAITDNDSAGVSIEATNVSATEGGANGSYTVVLTSQPTDTVTVSLTSDTQTSVTPAELTFTTANWNAAQAVRVMAVDDDAVEGTHNGMITHAATSSDTNYNRIGINSVAVSITDNDDNDEDGAADDMEDQVPNANGSGAGDGNGDGMPDSSQDNVASLPNSMTGEFVTLIVDDELSLTGVYAMQSLPEVPEEANFEQGYFDFGVTGLTNGGSFTVSFILHLTDSENLPNSYWKYGPTPDDQSDHWYNFAFDAQSGTGAEINGNTITLHFVDGARGDDDLTANGQISDPGGPAISQAPTALELTGFDSHRAAEWPKWLLVSMITIAGALLWRRRREA